jgi:MFS transporter, LAT3 family, solute carrier family 43, member 3
MSEGKITYSSLKIALITIQLLCTALFSGILFGWAPFQLIMIEEGLYECSHQGSGNGNDENSNGDNRTDDDGCLSQQANLTMLFTIATSTFLISSLFIGIFVDHYGPTRTVILNGIVVSLSLFLIAISPVEEEYLFVLVALLLGFGGGLTLTGAFPIAFVVDPSHMPILMSAINCFFDASAVIFLFCYLIYVHLEISRLVLFIVFGFIAVVLYVLLSILWYFTEPEFNRKKKATAALGQLELASSNPTEPTTVISSHSPPTELPTVTGATSEPLTEVVVAEGASTASTSATITGIPSITTIHSQHWFKNFPTRLFYFLSMYGAIQIFRFNYYFGSVLDLLEDLGDDKYNYLYTQIFIAMLPLGFLCLPLIDWIFKIYGFIGAFHVLNLLSIGYNVIVLIPILPLQVLTFLFFVTGRALLFSLIGTYVAHMFGPLNSGKMYGSFSWVAVLANVFQYPLFILVTRSSPGYEGLTYLNIFTLCLCLPMVWLCYHDLKIILNSYTGSDILVVRDKSYESLEPDEEIIVIPKEIEHEKKGRGGGEGEASGGMSGTVFNILQRNRREGDHETGGGRKGNGGHMEIQDLEGLEMVNDEIEISERTS